MTGVHWSPQLAVITALPKEHAAARRLLTEAEPVTLDGDPTLYTAGLIPGRHEPHRVVLACLSKYANNPAAVTTTNLLRSFPSILDIVFVGIAASVPRPSKPEAHVRLGDVVVSSGPGVVQFDLGARRPTHFDIRDTSPPPSARLLQAVNQLESEILVGQFSWSEHVSGFLSGAGVRRPSKEPPKPFKHPLDPMRVKGVPRIFRGKIGASNTLMKSAAHRDEIADQLGILAIEMEGSGVADATWEGQAGYLLVRGTCDYGDERKADSWQEYASHVAAAYLGALLLHLPVRQTEDHAGAKPASPRHRRGPASPAAPQVASGISPPRFHVSDRRLTCCAWIEDDSSIATAGFAGTVYIANAATGTLTCALELGDTIVRCLTPLPDRRFLLVGDDLGRISYLDLSTREVQEVARARSSVFSLSYCAAHGLLYSAERNGSVVEWGFKSPSRGARKLRVVHRHAGPAFDVAFDDHSRTCWSAGADGKLRGSHLDGGAPLDIDLSTATLFCFAQAGGTLVAGDSAGVLFVGGQGLRDPVAVEGHLDAVRSVALTATGAWAGTCGKDGTLRLWHVRSGRSWIVAESRDYLYDVCFSSSGTTLVGCDGSGDLLVVRFGERIDDFSAAALERWWLTRANSR